MIDIFSIIGTIGVLAMIIALEFFLVFFLSIKSDLDKKKNIITVSVYTRKEFHLKVKRENLTLEKALELKRFYEREENAIVLVTITSRSDLAKKKRGKRECIKD